MAPKIVDKEAKARSIAAAALRVFGERGFHATRMSDIAGEAGIGKGTVYEYFGDKLEILRSELERYFADFRDGAVQAVSAREGAAEQLAELVGFSIEHVEAWADHCAAFFDALGSARAGGLGQDWFAEMFDESRAMIQAILAGGQASGELRADFDPVAVSEAIVSLYEGYVLLAILGVRRCANEEFRAAVRTLLGDGLRRRN